MNKPVIEPMMSVIQPFPDLLSIAPLFQAIFLDAYGVFWQGNSLGLLPGTKEVMYTLVCEGKSVAILSNSTQLAASETFKLQKHGLSVGDHFHFLITSGEVMRSLLLEDQFPLPTPKKGYLLFCEDHPQFSHQPIFEGTAYQEVKTSEEADFIYVGVPHLNGKDQVDPQLFRPRVEELRKTSLPMVCANPDAYAHEGNPVRCVVRQGTIAAMYEEEGGEVVYIGKPGPHLYLKALELLSKVKLIELHEILMVGDTPETDIRGARDLGIPSALVVETGIMGDRVANLGLAKAIAQIPLKELPEFFLKRMAPLP